MYCVDTITGTIYIYSSNGDLYTLDNKLISNQKADWQIEQEKVYKEAELNKRLPFSGRWVGMPFSTVINKNGKTDVQEGEMEFYISDINNSIEVIIDNDQVYNQKYSYQYDCINKVYFIYLSDSPMKLSYTTQTQDGVGVLVAGLTDNKTGNLHMRKFTYHGMN